MSARNRRVTVSHIYPAGMRLEDIAGGGAFLGISLRNPVSNSPSLRPLIAWARSNFDPLAILLGDYIERHNLVAEARGNLFRAGELAMSKAEPIREIISVALQKDPAPPTALISSRDIISGPRFVEILGPLEQQFEQDQAFRGAILNDIAEYITRLKKRGRSLASKGELSDPFVRYILEELAIFSILSDQGLPVQVYPGRHLRTLVALANGRLSSPVPGLNDLKCIEVTISH